MINLRPVRSFVRRQGRMTTKQLTALDLLWSTYGCELGSFDFNKLFERPALTTLEIGFGMGDSLAEMAESEPDQNFLGIEVHQPGVGALLDKCHRLDLQNIRVMRDDVHEVLAKIPDGSLSDVYILFPDPWPKSRHHKRRIIQKKFLELLCPKMQSEGVLHLATDWQNYAEHMLEVCENFPALSNLFGKGNFAPHSFERFETKFERRGLKLGHKIYDLAYTVNHMSI
jgi:tRNA (guanine-N7-)-methyltransferase